MSFKVPSTPSPSTVCCLYPTSVSCLPCMTSEKEFLKQQDLFPDKQILCLWIPRLSGAVGARWDLRGCTGRSNSISRSDLTCVTLKHMENRLLSWLGVALIRSLIVQLISLGSLRQLRAKEVPALPSLLCPCGYLSWPRDFA